MSKKVKPESSDKSPDFEKSLAELEQIVARMEAGDLSLDQSLQQFERGVALARECQQALQVAEQKVEILLKQSGSNTDFVTAPFDSDDTDDE
ncbi:MAG TPA: exodeoxyribonuclease VII small subunit [Steroidobacteraceae bacterium]|nr:exodeoxyribonuclease VII small subunit [Steroidobacteraceae bacterium]